MEYHRFLFSSTILLFIVLNNVGAVNVKKFPLLMPNVHPDRFGDQKLVGFEPNATMKTAHHMLLYGCTKPGSNKPYWDCGEMASTDGRQRSSPCKEGSHVIYAWARDARSLKLPKDVGYQVGPGTPIQYLVLQVHYSNVDKFRDGSTDDSGVFLMYTEKPQSKLAGVLLLGTGGIIPPNEVAKMETDCEIAEDKEIYPFAYRTHTHSLGKVVAGYKVRQDENGRDHWTLLGKRSPLTPQTFYPVFNTEPIKKGDILAARCTMKSTRNRYTYVGATNEDEMCNFYLMYYVKRGSPLEMQYCFKNGPPSFYWDMEPQLNNIPDIDASVL